MTKTELKEELLNGATMDSLFAFTKGEECLIFHADRFSMADDIIYIPDTGLNKIPLNKTIVADRVDEVVSNCYTGKDFMDEAGGDSRLAERLFWLCNWQHPVSAHDDINDDDDDDKSTPVFVVISSVSLEFCNVTVHPGTIVKVSSEDSDASLTMVLPYDTDVCEIDAVLDQIREDKRGYGPAERERFRLNFADIIYGYFHDNGLRPASMNYDVDEAV